MGDHTQLAPATLEHLTAFSSQICRKMEDVEMNIQKMGRLQLAGTYSDMQHSFPYSFAMAPPSAYLPSTPSHSSPATVPHAYSHIFGDQTPPSANTPSTMPPLSMPSHTTVPHAFNQTANNSGYTFSFSQYTPSAPMAADQPRASSKKKRPQGVLPAVPGRRIPMLPSGSQAWVVSVAQWHEGNPDLDIMPLKDWPREWYTGDQLTVYGATYGKRRLVAEAFERYVVYPRFHATLAHFISLLQMWIRRRQISRALSNGVKIIPTSYQGSTR